MKTPPLAILGIDAGDPNLIQRWAQEGHLPTIASIMERGCWGKTAGPELISEHGVWVSLFSGISRSRHGYYYFRQLKPGTYDVKTVTGLEVDAPPFWACLLGGDKKAAIIDVPDNSPLPGLRGVQLANWATHNNWDPHHFNTAAEPAEILQDVYRNFGPKLTTVEKHESSLQEDRGIYRQLVGQVERKGALCRHLLARDRFDLVAVVFGESHVAGHQFWKYHADTQEGAKIGGDDMIYALRNVYRTIDREIGNLLARLPSECNVFVVSSVGMEDHYPSSGLIEAFCRRLSYQTQTKNGALRPLDLARRIVPESWRVALSRRFSREKRERLLADQFRSSTDWRKTTAFAVPAAYTSFVRVNLRGREPEGAVNPGEEYKELLDRLEADLRQLIDPETNQPAVTRVWKTVELFGCGPHPSLPDLFVEWKPGRFMRRVLHPKVELVQKRPEFYRRSDHSSHGFVGAAGPSIQGRGELGDISVLGLAPTFLALLGEPIPRRMTGRAIGAMIRTGKTFALLQDDQDTNKI